MTTLRVALAQINTTIGDLDGNVARIAAAAGEARRAGADIVSFPELTVTGYPPEDLLLRPRFIADQREALDRAVASCDGVAAVIGFVDQDEAGIYNAAAIVNDGRIVATYRKQRLPNYGVFDEMRYFVVDTENPVFTIAGAPVGVNICEDIWFPGNPTEAQAAAGARVIININGSPYHAGKHQERQEMLAGRARDYGVYVCYTNQVGGQDELMFDGGSMVLAPSGTLVARAKMFEEDLLIHEIDLPDEAPAPNHIRISDTPISERHRIEPRVEPAPGFEEEVYRALVLGTRDYLAKTGFTKALIALSGGIDSSIVASVAVDALGADNVVGVGMPSRYSSEGSVKDARDLADNLGIRFLTVPIEPAHASYLEMLEPAFEALDGGERGHGRGEHPVAHPRQRHHGPLQQVRLDRADDRQQERVRDRLRHPLRRHVRRVRRDQRRA
jgi:NAD+ synthase (glutamine-hydrolysing)